MPMTFDESNQTIEAYASRLARENQNQNINEDQDLTLENEIMT